MSVWISDEKLLIFASLISPSKMILFEKKYQTFDTVSCNMSKTRASALSRVPNTEKQMKARGRRPSAFICFEVFGTRDEARSPSF